MLETLGAYLARKRDEKSWSQRELGRKAQVSFTVIQRIESGDPYNPGIDTLRDLARALRVPLAHLVMAYQGLDPDSPDQQERKDKVSAFWAAFEALSPDDQKRLTQEIVGRMLK